MTTQRITVSRIVSAFHPRNTTQEDEWTFHPRNTTQEDHPTKPPQTSHAPLARTPRPATITLNDSVHWIFFPNQLGVSAQIPYKAFFDRPVLYRRYTSNIYVTAILSDGVLRKDETLEI